jgi:hypothetical protein
VRERMLEELFPGEVLEIRIVDPAIAHLFVGQGEDVLEQQKPDDEAALNAGPTLLVDGCQNPRKDGAAKKVGMALAFISAAPCSRTLGGKRWLGGKPCQSG